MFAPIPARYDHAVSRSISHRLPAAAAIIAGAVLAGDAVRRHRPGSVELPEAVAVAEGRVVSYGRADTPDGAVLRLRYRFTVDGADSGPRSQTATVAAEDIPDPARFAPGTAVAVSYDPADPARSIVREFPGRTPLMGRPQFLAGAGMMLLGIAYAAIHGLLRRRGTGST